MPTSNFGDARLLRHGRYSVTDLHNLGRKAGVNGFLLGYNRPYGHTANSPNVPLEAGEQYAMPIHSEARTGEQINSCEWGVAWDPSIDKGMGICIGSGRSGKGAGIILPSVLLSYAGNCVVTDPKGENAWIAAERRRAMGHKVALCDPFNVLNGTYVRAAKSTKPETILRYNPLGDLDPDALTFAEDVAGISEAITVVSQGDGSESGSFFSGAARDLIDGVIAAVVQYKPRGRAYFREVRDIISYDDKSFSEWVASFCADYPRTLGARKLADFVDMNRTNQGIKKTAKEQTKFLDSEELLRYMEPAPGENTYSLKELATGNLDLFIIIPATHTVTHSRFLRLMVNQSFRCILRARAKQQNPIAFILDEAGTTLGHLTEVENAYGLTAGMGILVWSFYQDLTQLQRDYPKSWETFIGNSACIQLMSAKDKTTLEYFSWYLGTKTVQQQSSGVSTSTNPGTYGQLPSTSVSQSQNNSEMGRPVMFAQEIRMMDDDEMLVIFPKKSSYRQWKIKYFSDARFNGLYRIDPLSPQTAYPDAKKSTFLALPNEADPNSKHQSRGNGFAAYRKPAYLGCCILTVLLAWGMLGGSVRLPVVVLFGAAAYFLKPKGTTLRGWWIDRNGILQQN